MKYDLKNIVCGAFFVGAFVLFLVARFIGQPLRNELFIAGFLLVVAGFAFTAVYNKVKFGTFFSPRDQRK